MFLCVVKIWAALHLAGRVILLLSPSISLCCRSSRLFQQLPPALPPIAAREGTRPHRLRCLSPVLLARESVVAPAGPATPGGWARPIISPAFRHRRTVCSSSCCWPQQTPWQASLLRLLQPPSDGSKRYPSPCSPDPVAMGR